jgi:hypothetical protein
MGKKKTTTRAPRKRAAVTEDTGKTFEEIALEAQTLARYQPKSDRYVLLVHEREEGKRINVHVNLQTCSDAVRDHVKRLFDQ